MIWPCNSYWCPLSCAHLLNELLVIPSILWVREDMSLKYMYIQRW